MFEYFIVRYFIFCKFNPKLKIGEVNYNVGLAYHISSQTNRRDNDDDNDDHVDDNNNDDVVDGNDNLEDTDDNLLFVYTRLVCLVQKYDYTIVPSSGAMIILFMIGPDCPIFIHQLFQKQKKFGFLGHPLK